MQVHVNVRYIHVAEQLVEYDVEERKRQKMPSAKPKTMSRSLAAPLPNAKKVRGPAVRIDSNHPRLTSCCPNFPSYNRR